MQWRLDDTVLDDAIAPTVVDWFQQPGCGRKDLRVAALAG